jgi:hypothetical protein
MPVGKTTAGRRIVLWEPCRDSLVATQALMQVHFLTSSLPKRTGASGMSRDAERIDLLVRISRDLLAVLREPRARRMVVAK